MAEKQSTTSKAEYKRAYYLAHKDDPRQRELARARSRAHYQRHRKRLLALKKIYQGTPRGREVYRKSCRVYYANHHEAMKERTRNYNRQHRIEKLLYAKNYYYSHRAERLEYARKFLQANRAKLLERGRIYRMAHRAELVARARAYFQAHPDVKQAINNRRRARIAGAPRNDLTAAQWREIMAAYGFRCVYCPASCWYCKQKKHKLTMDHIEPIAKGGSHTASNIVPACRSCNEHKHTGPPPVPVQPILLTIALPRTE